VRDYGDTGGVREGQGPWVSSRVSALASKTCAASQVGSDKRGGAQEAHLLGGGGEKSQENMRSYESRVEESRITVRFKSFSITSESGKGLSRSAKKKMSEERFREKGTPRHLSKRVG